MTFASVMLCRSKNDCDRTAGLPNDTSVFPVGKMWFTCPVIDMGRPFHRVNGAVVSPAPTYGDARWRVFCSANGGKPAPR